MLKRIKRLWKLTNKDEKALKQLEELSDEQIDLIPDENYEDGVFFGEGTQEEYDQLEKEDSGMSGWYKRLRNL